MQLKSRPLAEIIALVYTAIEQGVYNIHLNAENSTEYGCDIGSSFSELLETLLAIDQIRFIDISGTCLDEISPKTLRLLQHRKVRLIELEVQSLNDLIRKAMGLHKTHNEALDILDALHNKYIVSNFITGFINCSIKEFDKELKLIQRHHLYYLSISPYNDTEGTPSHQLYQKPSEDELFYYQSAFATTVAAERQLLLEQLVAMDSIEATVTTISEKQINLMPTNYAIRVVVRNHDDNLYRVGDLVHVKITRLRRALSNSDQQDFLTATGHADGTIDSEKYSKHLQDLQYFNGYDQIMTVKGTIITS